MTGTIEPLTPREREVARLVAADLTDRAIARRLDVALPTVRRHLDNIIEKLGRDPERRRRIVIKRFVEAA